MDGRAIRFEDDLSLVLCGEAGQGIQSVELLATKLLKGSGCYVFSTKEFMSRIRGGSNSTSIRLSSRRFMAPLDRVDILIPLDINALLHVERRLSAETVVFADEEILAGASLSHDPVMMPVPFKQMALELGNALYTNMVEGNTIRRNPDITNIVHNNMVYGLTKGQASPTSYRGFITPVQVKGVAEEPFNPLAVAVAQGATFVARAFAGHREQTSDLMVKAISHRGYALPDILQPCVSFNKFNTFKWFSDHTAYLDASHDSSDRIEAFRRSLESDVLPLGVFYEETGRATFEETFGLYETNTAPLFRRERDMEALRNLLDGKRK